MAQRRTSLARLARTTSSFAAIGLVVSVVVAWGLLFVMPARVGPVVVRAPDDPVIAPLRDDPRRSAFASQLRFAPGSDAINLWGSDGTDRTTSAFFVSARAGWPFRCVRGERLVDSRSGERLHGAWSIPDGWRWRANTIAGIIPWQPAWPGLLADTLLFGTLAWLATRGPRAIRHHGRRRRGMCEQCGYTLAGADRCPECGTVSSARLP